MLSNHIQYNPKRDILGNFPYLLISNHSQKKKKKHFFFTLFIFYFFNLNFFTYSLKKATKRILTIFFKVAGRETATHQTGAKTQQKKSQISPNRSSPTSRKKSPTSRTRSTRWEWTKENQPKDSKISLTYSRERTSKNKLSWFLIKTKLNSLKKLFLNSPSTKTLSLSLRRRSRNGCPRTSLLLATFSILLLRIVRLFFRTFIMLLPLKSLNSFFLIIPLFLLTITKQERISVTQKKKKNFYTKKLKIKKITDIKIGKWEDHETYEKKREIECKKKLKKKKKIKKKKKNLLQIFFFH